MSRLTMTDGKVPADERLRLVNLHGADEAARLIAEAEAAATPEKPASKGKATSEKE